MAPRRVPDTLTPAEADAYRDRLVGVAELAARHHVAVPTMYRWLERRRLPRHLRGRPPAPRSGPPTAAEQAAMDAYHAAYVDFATGRGSAAAVEQAKRDLIAALKEPTQ
jgi:hypothetical protein